MLPPLGPAADTAAASKEGGLIATEAPTAALVWSSELRAMSDCDA